MFGGNMEYLYFMNGGTKMKYCEKCKKELDTEDEKCPICGKKLKKYLVMKMR